MTRPCGSASLSTNRCGSRPSALQGDKSIARKTDDKLILLVYQRVRATAPTMVGEGAPQGEVARRIRRMLFRLGVAAPPANNGIVEEAIATLCSVTGDSRATVEGKLRAFTAEGPDGICSDIPACLRCEVSGLCRSLPRRPSIKDLPPTERPRERLLAEGPQALSDSDLLGIIIRGGAEKESAVDLAKRLLSAHGDLRRIATLSTAELTRVRGIGPAKAAQIKAVFEIAKRFASIEFKPGQKFTSSEQVFDHYHQQFQDAREERFMVVLLDSQHKFIGDRMISKGSLDATIVHPREVLAPAIRESAAAMIFVHNHPSGEITPSPEDIELTDRLVEAAKLIGIQVLDHIIIGNGDFSSMAEKGLI